MLDGIVEIFGYDPGVMARSWRQRPVVFRGAAHELAGAIPLPTLAESLQAAESARREAPGTFHESTDGATIFVNGAEQTSASLARLGREVARTLGWPDFGVDVSIQKRTGRGVGAHFDDGDNLVCQVVGSKTWYVGRPDDLPQHLLRSRMLKEPGFVPTVGRPKVEPIMLNPGDVLYLPLFAPHEGVSDCTSLSISIGHYARSVSSEFDRLAARWGSEVDAWKPLPVGAPVTRLDELGEKLLQLAVDEYGDR